MRVGHRLAVGLDRLSANFHVLLLLLLVSLFLQAFAHSHMGVRDLNAGVFLLVIYAVVRVTSESKATSYSGYGLLVVWMSIHAPAVVIHHAVDQNAVPRWLDLTGDIANVIVIGWLQVQMVIALMGMKRVSSREISASLCTYILLGIWFFAVYSLLPPGDFHPELSSDVLKDVNSTKTERPDLFYYSFVTLTSLGYGDVTPVSQAARSLSILEVILGQFFLAVLIARQVGLYLMSRGTDASDGSE